MVIPLVSVIYVYRREQIRHSILSQSSPWAIQCPFERISQSSNKRGFRGPSKNEM